jgi:hypothetical protein
MSHATPDLRLVTPAAHGVTIAVGAEQCLKFTNEGVIYGVNGAPDLEPWSKVSDLRVVFPAVRSRSWTVLQTILEVLAPVTMRSNQTRLELETFANGWRFYDLGYPDAFGASAPQRQALAVEAVIDRLAERGQLRRLGDPDFMRAMLEGLPVLAPPLAPVMTWKVNRHVDSVLAREHDRKAPRRDPS